MKPNTDHNLVSITMSEELWGMIADAVTEYYFNDRWEYFGFMGDVGKKKSKHNENKTGEKAEFITNLIHMHCMGKWGEWGAE